MKKRQIRPIFIFSSYICGIKIHNTDQIGSSDTDFGKRAMKERVLKTAACITVLLASLLLICDDEDRNCPPDIRGTVKADGMPCRSFPSLASMSMTQAIAKSLAKVQGEVLYARLKPVNGYLTFEVAIVQQDNILNTITIDAGSGDILSADKN